VPALRSSDTTSTGTTLPARRPDDAGLAAQTSALRLNVDAALDPAEHTRRPPLHVTTMSTATSSIDPLFVAEVAAESSNRSALTAAEFLATRVFDVPSFTSLDSTSSTPPGYGQTAVSANASASAHASSAVLATLAPRCEAAEVDQLAAGWDGAVLIGPVPSAAGAGVGMVGSPSSMRSLGATPTTPLGMTARHHSLSPNGYLDAGGGNAVGDADAEGEAHRTLYVTLPEPAPAPTPPKSPVETKSFGEEKGSPIDEKTFPQRRPLPTRRRSRSTSSSVAATLRHAVLNILDLASEELSCSTVVFVLERNRPDLADLLHGLCYVGGQVLHVKGAARGFNATRTGSLAGSAGSGSRRSISGGVPASWNQRTPRASPATAAGSNQPHRGSYGSIGSITAQFPGSVVMPLRIAGREGAGATSATSPTDEDGNDLLLLPRADVILVAVAL